MEQPENSKEKKRRPTALPAAPNIIAPPSPVRTFKSYRRDSNQQIYFLAICREILTARNHQGAATEPDQRSRTIQCVRCPLEELRQVTYYGLLGGLTVKETLWRVLGKMVPNSLAKTINWRGVNVITGFEFLALKDVVLKSVRRNSVTAQSAS